MTTIVTRSGKGSPLSWAEADANLTNLNTDKLEAADLSGYETSAHASATYAPITTTVTDSDIGVTVQGYSANLSEYAAVNPTAAGLALLDDVDAAAQRTTLGLGTAATSNTGDFQAADADIPTVSASQAEMVAGTEANLRSMSPLRVSQAITGAFNGSNQSLAVAGFQKFPGGLLLQWGSISVGADTTASVTWPVAFPTGVLNAFVCQGIAINTAVEAACSIYNMGTVGATVTNGLNATTTLRYLSVGY